MTEICFLNDGWHHLKESIEDDPKKFTRSIDELINGRPIYSNKEYLGCEYPGDFDDLMHLGNGSTIYPSHHADNAMVYLSWRNSFLRLDKYSLEREFGHRLTKPSDFIRTVLIEDIQMAERMLREAKKWLKELDKQCKG